MDKAEKILSDPNMTLLQKAWAIPCIAWFRIDQLIAEATTPELKEQLRSIQVSKYRQEEALV